MRRRLSTTTFLVTLLFSSLATAQVNTENLRKRVKVVGYSALLEATLTGDTGNTQGMQAGAGIGGGLAQAPHLAFFYARIDYSRFNGATQMDKSFAHARYDFEFQEDLWGELFAQAQSDEFQRLKLRNLFGVGPRVRVLHVTEPSELELFVGTAYMLERDVIRVLPGAPDESVQIWHRWSTYLTGRWQPDSRVIFASTMYVQPALQDFSNVRLLSETIFTFVVTPFFHAGISGTVHYDSAPPTAVKSVDTEIKNTLSLTF